MDLADREAREKEIEQVLAVVWREWTDRNDPNELSQQSLEDLLQEHAIDKIWAVWVRANLELLQEYGQEQTNAQLAAAFLLFFRRWRDSVASRWNTRIRNYLTEVETNDRRELQQAVEQNRTPSALLNIVDIEAPVQKEPPAPWPQARFEIVVSGDLNRESVTLVTETQSDGEVNAARVIGRGQQLMAIWRTETNPCEFCGPLDGLEARTFPPLHPNCRCHLEWRVRF